MPLDYVVLEAIQATGYSKWLVCEIKDGKLTVTNTCHDKPSAVHLASVHAEKDQERYNTSLHLKWR